MLFHLLHPAILYLGRPQPAPARMPAFDIEGFGALDPDLRDPLVEAVTMAQGVGFGMPLFAGGDPEINGQAAVAFLERPDRRALAFIHASRSGTGSTSVASTISTRFDDGQLLMTSNFGGIPRTPPRPEVDGVAIPDHFGFAPLWAVHQHRIQARETQSAVTPMTRGGDPLGYAFDELCELYDLWVTQGYYTRLPDGRIKPTLRGACLASWRGLWPWKQLTNRRNRRRTAEAVRDMPLIQ